MRIQFINHQEWGIEPASFRRPFDRLKKTLKTHSGILNVVFVTDAEIQALNKAYRHKDKPTDVLSFNHDTTLPGGEGLLGEIYISVDTAKRQARAAKWNLGDELNKLFVHGILHIHGYDHQTEEEYAVMHGLEVRILGKDKAPVYAEED